MAKQNTHKFVNKKVRDTGDISDYEKTPIGADSDNIDRPDGSTAEENFVNIDNGVDIGRTLKYEDPYLYLLDGEGKELSRVTLVLPSHVHNYEVTITKEATYTEAGLKKCTCACGDNHTEEIPMLVDSTNPTGTITVGENTYTSLVENPSFNTYFKTAQNVTIAGVDNESGVKSISYYVSDTKVDETGLADVAWVAYDSGFTIEPNRNAIVYAKITDNQDNVTYICSDGIVLDNIAPVFNGMEDGGTYGVGTTLTLQDGETLFVNGTEVELTNNTYTFNVEDNYLLSIKDRAGNQSSTITITIHAHNFVNNICTICGEGLAPANEYEKWDYTLDDAAKKVTLNKYTGTDENVTVYSNYDVDGECYKTRIGNSFKDYNEYNNLVDMNLFTNNTSVKNIVFQKGIDTSDTTNMSAMFNGCSSLTSLDTSDLETNNTTNMNRMFCNCSALTSLNVSNLDTSKVTNMDSMFNGCKSLSSLNVSHFDTSNVTDMWAMFANCISLVSLDLSNFDTSKVTKMVAMFSAGMNKTSALTTLNLSNWNTSNVENMMDMFKGCISLKTIIGLNNFNTSNVTNMGSMFKNCSSLTSLDVSNFDTSNAKYISEMFINCSSLISLDLSNFNTSNVTDMYAMFDGCSALTSINLGNLDTANVTNMSYMFENCSSLTSLDLSSWDTSNVTDISRMFKGCNSLTSLDVSNFDTSNVTNMSYMFNECSVLTFLDLSSWDTNNVTNMDVIFCGCLALTSLDVSNFDTSKVTSMWNVFSHCSSLISLDLSNFDTNNVTNMNRMFINCTKLTSIYVTRDKWIIKEGCHTEDMFTGCGVNEVTYKDAA